MANGNMNPMQPNEGALLKPVSDIARTAAKAGKLKKIKLSVKFKDKK